MFVCVMARTRVCMFVLIENAVVGGQITKYKATKDIYLFNSDETEVCRLFFQCLDAFWLCLIFVNCWNFFGDVQHDSFIFGVATVSRLLKNIGLFCRISYLL